MEPKFSLICPLHTDIFGGKQSICAWQKSPLWYLLTPGRGFHSSKQSSAAWAASEKASATLSSLVPAELRWKQHHCQLQMLQNWSPRTKKTSLLAGSYKMLILSQPTSSPCQFCLISACPERHLPGLRHFAFLSAALMVSPRVPTAPEDTQVEMWHGLEGSAHTQSRAVRV